MGAQYTVRILFLMNRMKNLTTEINIVLTVNFGVKFGRACLEGRTYLWLFRWLQCCAEYVEFWVLSCSRHFPAKMNFAAGRQLIGSTFDGHDRRHFFYTRDLLKSSTNIYPPIFGGDLVAPNLFRDWPGFESWQQVMNTQLLLLLANIWTVIP
jgi:hypothetical protein